MKPAWEWDDNGERRAMQRFAMKNYRAGERKLIQSVIEGKDTLGVMPAGGGTALCYQLPALFLPGPVLVISPQVLLTHDEQKRLSELNVSTVGLDSSLSSKQALDAIDSLKRDQPVIIYFTLPAAGQEIPELLKVLEQAGISLAVVYEAHNFRPSCPALRELFTKRGRPPVLALTSKTTIGVATDLLKQAGLSQPEIIEVGFERPNMSFDVIRTVNDNVKRERLKALLNDEAGGIGIVYVPTAQQADELGKWLVGEGINAGQYHTRMKPAARDASRQAFLADGYAVMVATKAFAPGIDKQNIRCVIHYAVPESLESYIHESGHAGRDGKPARAVLFYRLEDRRIQSYFIGGKYPRREESLAVYRSLDELARQEDLDKDGAEQWLAEAAAISDKRVKVVLALLKNAGIISRTPRPKKIRDFETDDDFTNFLAGYEQRHNSDRQRLDAMMLYGQITTCRMRYLTAYFGEESGSDCGHCDNCRATAPSGIEIGDSEIGASVTALRAQQVPQSLGAGGATVRIAS